MSRQNHIHTTVIMSAEFLQYAHSGKELIEDIAPATIIHLSSAPETWTATGPVTPKSLSGSAPDMQHIVYDKLAHHPDSFAGRIASKINKRSAYAELVQHAPQVPQMLSQMSLLHAHPASLIHDTLRTPNCVCCGFFGAFVLALTMERCCLTCLQKNPATWTLPAQEAADIFGLTAGDVEELPSFTARPGEFMYSSTKWEAPTTMVSVRQAKNFAVTLFGQKYLARHVDRMLERGHISEQEAIRWQQLHATQTVVGPCQPFHFGPGEFQRANFYGGLGAIRFPVLLPQSKGLRVEKGLWCRGCEAVCQHWAGLSDEDQARATQEALARSCRSLRVAPHALFKCEWTKEQFLDHAQDCLGVQALMEGAR